jgi:hypothetical protein
MDFAGDADDFAGDFIREHLFDNDDGFPVGDWVVSDGPTSFPVLPPPVAESAFEPMPFVSKPDALLDHLGALHICLSI